MPNREVSKIRKQFGLEVDLEYSLILSSIKPEEQDEANRWDRERRLLKHHKTKYPNVLQVIDSLIRQGDHILCSISYL